jgi:hypothetical protein
VLFNTGNDENKTKDATDAEAECKDENEFLNGQVRLVCSVVDLVESNGKANPQKKKNQRNAEIVGEADSNVILDLGRVKIDRTQAITRIHVGKGVCVRI